MSYCNVRVEIHHFSYVCVCYQSFQYSSLFRKLSTFNNYMQKYSCDTTQMWLHIEDVTIEIWVTACAIMKHNYHICSLSCTRVVLTLKYVSLILNHKSEPQLLEDPDKSLSWILQHQHVLTGLFGFFFSLLVAIISLSLTTTFGLFWPFAGLLQVAGAGWVAGRGG